MVDVSRETRELLDQYVQLLRKWNARLNLVSRQDAEGAIYTRHIPEALALAALIPPGTDRLIDLGTGGGLPAIPVAVVTGKHVDLIETDQRKAAFLINALSALKLQGTVWNERIEHTSAPLASCITAGALADLSTLLTYAAPLLKQGGCALFLKGHNLEAEVEAARQDWLFHTEISPPIGAGTRILTISSLESRHAAKR